MLFKFFSNKTLGIIAQVYLLWRLKKTENYCTPIHQRQSRFLIWPEPWAAEPCKEPRLSSAWIKSMGNLLHYSMGNLDDNIFFFSAPSDKWDQYSMKRITRRHQRRQEINLRNKFVLDFISSLFINYKLIYNIWNWHTYCAP